MGRLARSLIELLKELALLLRRPEQVPPDCVPDQVLPTWESWSAEQKRQKELQRQTELEIEIERASRSGPGA